MATVTRAALFFGQDKTRCEMTTFWRRDISQTPLFPSDSSLKNHQNSNCNFSQFMTNVYHCWNKPLFLLSTTFPCNFTLIGRIVMLDLQKLPSGAGWSLIHPSMAWHLSKHMVFSRHSPSVPPKVVYRYLKHIEILRKRPCLPFHS